VAEGEAMGAKLVGAVAVFAAAWVRGRQGLAPVPPDPSLPHAADYLRMIHGTAPDAARASGLDAYLVTVADHGMNASTFAARLVASTGSDCVSAITAGIGALKGPLHGGAPGPVLDMLDAIGAPERASAWLEEELREGRRIMGMGHRVYRVRDPRAAVLEKQVERLSRAGRSTGRLQLARAVERAALGVLRTRYPHRPLHANVEFYTAVLLDSLGLPASLFTPTFAVGRASGWYAHIQEQRRTGRLIRPASRYVGERPLPTHS
jgi:citrate synthase